MRTRTLQIAAPALLSGLLLTGCYDSSCSDCGGGSAPSFPTVFEVESNDTPDLANYFGSLRPGDSLIIEGRISDSGFDPFDGFAFTAEVPLHVDFQLFIDDALADFDVCLYDPQIDAVVDCFQTANNPEQGGVDVTIGGLDFHLVVESFVGSTTYGLEIFVDTLIPSLRAAPGGAGVLGHGGSDPEGRGRARFEGYGGKPRTRLVQTITTEIDLESGLILEIVTTRQVPAGSTGPTESGR